MQEPNAISIAAVLRHYGARSVPEGAGWRDINCPFHSDAHASARVNTELGAFKCHGCGMSGDAIKLIRLKEQKGYAEAIEFAGSVLGESVENLPRTASKQKQRRPLGREKWKSILD